MSHEFDKSGRIKPPTVSELASADAVVKLRLNQVEKMLPVKLDLPTTVAPNQRVQIDVPQMTSSNLHERFRWPTDKVLLLSMGVVATPGPTKDNPISDAVTDAMPMLKGPPRADAILFVESAGIVACDERQFRVHRGMGLVPQVFDGDVLRGLPGSVAVGHTRYSTTGSSHLRNAQPLTVDEKEDGEPILVIDSLGAGRADRVIACNDGAGTRKLMDSKNSPVRWFVMGICDQ